MTRPGQTYGGGGEHDKASRNRDDSSPTDKWRQAGIKMIQTLNGRRGKNPGGLLTDDQRFLTYSKQRGRPDILAVKISNTRNVLDRDK